MCSPVFIVETLKYLNVQKSDKLCLAIKTIYKKIMKCNFDRLWHFFHRDIYRMYSIPKDPEVLNGEASARQATLRKLFNGETPFLSLIMLVHNKPSMTRKAIETLLSMTYYDNYELIIVDNASKKKTCLLLEELARSHHHVRLITNPVNLSFSRANNQAARHAKGDFFLFINNDTEIIDPRWLLCLATDLVSRPQCAAVGPRLIYPRTGRIQSAGITIFLDGTPRSYAGAKEIKQERPSRYVDALTSACILIRRAVFESIGGFDERFVFGQEDIDLCLRIIADGHKLYYSTGTTVIHHESATRKMDDQIERNKQLMHEKWRGTANALSLIDN